ncbi:hypothetical protein JS756_27590 [Streptomyces actuosus]|uniref:Uncharacterized protein n=1 Tax=Streptomyces actuosus TaxID=1885 RepID=A0ABS2VY31_STRAS|nr:hypothetical protein [Streptomyces actuosus]MBN0047805.1 hypothetical protein [Streptomyces actuosus]
MTEDIGLSWMAAQCDDLEDLPPDELDCLAEHGPVAATLRIAARSVTDLDRSGALRFGQDVRRLSQSPLSDGTLRTVWVGATDHVFDPAKDGVRARDWLGLLEEAWLSAERRAHPAFVPPAAAPVTDCESRRAVLRAMCPLADGLTDAAEKHVYPLPLPGLVPALEQVVVHACADLGYRLFLRALKAYFVLIDKTSHDAFIVLGRRFGYPALLVEDNLNYQE